MKSTSTSDGPMKHQIHVNQHVIRRNRKTGERKAPLTCKGGGTNEYGHEVVIYGQDGLEAARVVYRPDHPLSCGAVCWVQTECKVKVGKRRYKPAKEKANARPPANLCRTA